MGGRRISRRSTLLTALLTPLRTTFLVLAIPMIAIGLVALRLSSLRQLDEFQPGQPGLVTGGAVKED